MSSYQGNPPVSGQGASQGAGGPSVRPNPGWQPDPAGNVAEHGAVRLTILTLFFLSGACGLVYEVVWMRMLTLVFGATAFATSTILASFFSGLALGSFSFGRAIDRGGEPLKADNMEEMRKHRESVAPLLVNLGETPEDSAAVAERIHVRYEATQHSMRGDVLLTLGREDEARMEYNLALLIDPEDKNWMNPVWRSDRERR